jgi:Fe-S-cluster-containing dehydrogenase component
VDLQGNDLDKPVFHYDTNQNMYTLHEHPEYRWGMAVDLDSCTGCGACIVACDIENNIPIVGIQMDMPMPGQGTMQIGKRLLKQGREMHWMRMERFFETYDTDQPDVRFIPAMCQQCENAPCETVCPVYATMHTPDGINGMMYNRCVGTRYCGNNCPYKQRRLNWLTHDWPEAQKLALNPEVTVRTKGVMEKCNFCIQRVRTATTQSRIEGRRVADGEIVVACQQTCPADALIFGDLKDPNTRVSQAVAAGRSYRVFEELNTRPGVHYRKKIKRTPVIA